MRARIYAGLFLLTAFFCTNLQAAPRLEVTTKSGDKVIWKWNGEWEFRSDGDEQGQALFYKINLDLPSELKLQKAKLKSGLSKIADDGKRLTLWLPGFENQLGVLFTNGSKQFYRLKMQMDQAESTEKGCAKQQLKLEVPRRDAGLFYGIACTVTKENVLVTVSFPLSAEWVSSNIFESAGKGERWKTYQFKTEDLAGRSGEIGAFQVQYGNNTYEVKLTSLNKPGLKKPKETTNLYASGIIGQFTMKTVGGDPSSMQPGIRLEAGTRPLMGRFGIWADLITAFPLGGKEKAQSFLEFMGSLTWIPRERKSFHAIPFLGYDSLSQDQSDLNISFKHGNIALGVRSVNPMEKESEFSVTLWGSGITGGDSTNYVIDLKYVWPKSGRAAWFAGGSYRMQKAEGKTAQDEGEFSQMIISVGQKF